MATPRIIAAKHPESNLEGAWGLYMVDKDRWLTVTFRTELDAERFCQDLMSAREPSCVSGASWS